MRLRTGLAVLMSTLVIAVGACGGAASEPGLLDEAAIYGDLVVRLCDQARCGPSHPAFVMLDVDTPDARAAVLSQFPDAVFIASTNGLIGPDDQVIEGGRIIKMGPLCQQADDRIVRVDTHWETSRFEGKGETYVYEWNDTAWANVEPSTVGITVTTAVP